MTCTAWMCTQVDVAVGWACPDPTRLLIRYVSSTALKEGRGPTVVGMSRLPVPPSPRLRPLDCRLREPVGFLLHLGCWAE